MRKSKRGITTDVLFYLIAAVILLTIMLMAFFIMREKDMGILDFVKNILRFRK